MLDPVTLDQLRMLVCVVEEGSFSAAARKLQRVQSAVSTAMTNLETQLGVTIWDRRTKVAKLTDEGKAVVGAARRVGVEVDGLLRLSAGLVQGLEASVSLCVDQLFPLDALVELCAAFAREFPSVDLRVDTQNLSAVSARVLDGRSSLGVVSPLGVAAGLERRALSAIRMVPVVSAAHPLAKAKGRIGTARLADFVQIVLSERRDDGVPDQAVLSPRTWRVADLHTKHAMLLAGLGWGNLPEHLVHQDIAAGRLSLLRLEAWAEEEHTLVFSAVFQPSTTLGPAHLWLLENLEAFCTRHAPPLKKTRKA